MLYDSVPVEQSCEFINASPTDNPLISKCQIKVCYVKDTPNRNGSVITKEVARNELVKSLPGCPIVGFYNKEEEDYEEHNKIVTFKNGEVEFSTDTTPLGFVDVHPLIWFQKFIEEGEVREYLMTQGYIWTEMFPEAKRIIEQGNNQSMELSQDSIEGTWANFKNTDAPVFIISKALIENLCVLGENYEPCFEGAQIKSSFSLNDDTLNALYSMAQELKDTLNKGVNTHMKVKPIAVTGIEDSLVISAYNHGKENGYSLVGLYETVDEEPAIQFSYYTDTKSGSYFKADMTKVDNEYSFGEYTEVVSGLEGIEPQFSVEDFAAEDVNDEQTSVGDVEESVVEEPTQVESTYVVVDDVKESIVEESVEEVTSPEGTQSVESEVITDEPSPAAQFTLSNDEVVQLIKDNEKLKTDYSLLNEEYKKLVSFKNEVEKQQKLDIIDKFSMVDESYKAGIIDKLDQFTPDEIEANLAVYCFRNKINFTNEPIGEDATESESTPTVTFMLDNEGVSDNTPEWFKRAQELDKNLF